MTGIRGRLITPSFANEVLPTLPGFSPAPAAVRRQLHAWAHRRDRSLGPASSVRAIADTSIVPLLGVLGLTVDARRDTPTASWMRVAAGTRAQIAALVAPWDEPLHRVWRDAVQSAIGSDVRWCLCSNGVALRVVDAQRTWSRDFLEFDLAVLESDATTQDAIWSLLGAHALDAPDPLLDRAAILSARHGLAVCRALGGGVLEALQVLLDSLARRGRRADSHLLFEQSLTVLYRVLFLLFAEARGLVPTWHPIYRDRYSVETIVTALLEGRHCRGIWPAVQAISRLAHAGCSAGDLKVTAFNGRLFSPVEVAGLDRQAIDDTVMARAVIAVSSTPDGPAGRRSRIAYRELGVEQLGAVYEHVLDYEPGHARSASVLTRTRDVRKASGSYYTPRAVTSWLVRRTLGPVVAERTADEILQLKVLDPAMGSGAFLVSACRYLATAAEDALVRDGRWQAHDVTAADRIALRREVAARCLFGADLNPMAVQLARLSLWLATLAADKPLSFLDHHLVCGDSLVGGTPADLARQPGGGDTGRRPGVLPLFGDASLSGALEEAVRVRTMLMSQPDDSAAIVRDKERSLARLQRPGTALARWSRALDLWCAAWFWEGRPLDRRTFGELLQHVLNGRSALPAATLDALSQALDAARVRHHFLHWPLAFPEAFTGPGGEPLGNPGFDAILGNPPWDMVRGDSGEAPAREGRRAAAHQVTRFVRGAGIYRVESRAHVNRYQLFVERALQLTRNGGRVGLVLPSGIVSDAGAAPLRRHLFERAAIDEVTGLDNRERIFPIHRSVRFVLLTCTAGSPTTGVRARFGITRPEHLEGGAAGDPLYLTRAFITRVSGSDDLGLPELASPRDLAIVDRVTARVPRLGDSAGWAVQFGRELNATEDRFAFTPFDGDPQARPVIEGKQIGPFRVSLDGCRHQLAAGAPQRVHVPRRPRLAYRDVASATNRLTLIAAIVPARCVTTHTLFCLKTPLPSAQQHVLCALLNSFVANYLVRLRVNTHVTVSLVSRLPVPFADPGSAAFDRLRVLSRTLSEAAEPFEAMEEYAELQALAADLYALTPEDFEHVLGTFPLIPEAVKQRALALLNARPSDERHHRDTEDTESDVRRAARRRH